MLWIDFLTGRRRLERMYQEILDSNPTTKEIWKLIVEKLELSYFLKEGKLENISSDHPSIIIANHPFGLVDGIMLEYLISHWNKVKRSSYFRPGV